MHVQRLSDYLLELRELGFAAAVTHSTLNYVLAHLNVDTEVRVTN